MLKQTPLRLTRYVDRRLRTWTFNRSMRQFLQWPDYTDISQTLLHRLVEGWNNPWSAKEEYIRAFLAAAASACGPILECGSGLSTLLLGAVAARNRQQVWCLEHDPHWSMKLRHTLKRFSMSNVQVCLSPIANYGDFSWYAPPLADLPTDFALAVCDGPPGSIVGGRYGFLPIMRRHCRADCEILLDDAQRHSEREILQRWSCELGTSFSIEGEVKPFGRLRMAEKGISKAG